MITVYTRDGCSSCVTLKQKLSTMGIAFEEKKIDVDISKEEINALYPSAVTLPIMVAGNRLCCGSQQCNEAINEMGADLGKEFLTE